MKEYLQALLEKQQSIANDIKAAAEQFHDLTWDEAINKSMLKRAATSAQRSHDHIKTVITAFETNWIKPQPTPQ